MNPSDLGTHPLRRSPTTLSRRIADGMLLTAVDADEILRLSSTGATIWECLDAPRTRAEVVEMIAEVFSVDPRIVEEDVAPLFQQLVDRGWIVDADDGV